jgi:SAM-dependent methyltransferase
MNDRGSGVERQRAHFNNIAAQYTEGRKERNHQVVKELIWETGLRDVVFEFGDSPIKALEPMCGTGEGRELISKFITKDFEYHGFDYSEEIIAQGKAASPDASIWQADATTVELPEEAYDIVVILGGLHHVYASVDTVIARAARALKRNGYFINFEPTHGNRLFAEIREGIYERNRIFDAETERAFAVSELRSLFASAGFENIKATYSGLAAYVLYYNPYAFPMLNIGSEAAVRAIFAVDSLFIGNPIGRFLSFATFSVWRKKS